MAELQLSRGEDLEEGAKNGVGVGVPYVKSKECLTDTSE